MPMLDFDEIDHWAPSLYTALRALLPDNIGSLLSARSPEFLEDAPDLLFEFADRDEIIDAALNWVRSSTIVAYHGTRLTETELESVQTNGLLPLRAETRRNRLVRALSAHPRWSEVSGQLDAVLRSYGSGAVAGRREHQVHLSLSRHGLTDAFNHYLTHGSEFDQRVAHALLGAEGQEFLRQDGKPRLVQVAIPGDKALDAAHPIFDVASMRARGDIPNVICHFIESWSFRLAYPKFQPKAQKVDSGFVFRVAVPVSWIMKIETLNI